jgi:hypothetical protein
MKKEEFLRLLIEQNDSKLTRTEGKLKREIDRIYEKAVAEAVKEFKALEKTHPNAKANSAKVKKIIDKVWKAFEKEFEKLVEPIQKETFNCYDEGLEETALAVAAGEGEKSGDS